MIRDPRLIIDTNIGVCIITETPSKITLLQMSRDLIKTAKKMKTKRIHFVPVYENNYIISYEAIRRKIKK